MELLIIIIKIIIGFYIIMITVNFKKYITYMQTYKNINSSTYSSHHIAVKRIILYNKPSITWNYSTNNFIIHSKKNYTLNNDFMLKIDFIKYYWWLKYKNWFKTNFPELK